jgi:hypothetical protein
MHPRSALTVRSKINICPLEADSYGRTHANKRIVDQRINAYKSEPGLNEHSMRRNRREITRTPVFEEPPRIFCRRDVRLAVQSYYISHRQKLYSRRQVCERAYLDIGIPAQDNRQLIDG